MPTIPVELDKIKHNEDGRKRAKRVGVLYIIVSNYNEMGWACGAYR